MPLAKSYTIYYTNIRTINIHLMFTTLASDCPSIELFSWFIFELSKSFLF